MTARETNSSHNKSNWICSFHVTWIAFWFCFFVWFCTTNIYSFISSSPSKHNNNTNNSLSSLTIIDHQIAGGLSMASTILFRLIIGYFLPKYGSRLCYIAVLLLTAVTLISLTIINNKISYFICHFFLGVTGASFVVTQYHTTKIVSGKVYGFAQAITAGFGNFGGGCANSVMPLVLYYFGLNWRICMIILSVFMIILSIIYYFMATEDHISYRSSNSLSAYRPIANTGYDAPIQQQQQQPSPIDLDQNPSLQHGSQSTQSTQSTQSRTDSNNNNGVTPDENLLVNTYDELDNSRTTPSLESQQQYTTADSLLETICDSRVWILFLCYAICFGVELTFYCQAAYWFQLRFEFNEIISGILVMIWSSMNLPARPFGGYFSDKYDLRKRVYLLAMVLAFEGILALSFGVTLIYNKMEYSLILTVIVMLLFSWTVQMAEGIVFSIVPFIKPGNKSVGHVMGIVGSGGNFGAAVFIFCIFIPFAIHDVDDDIMNPWVILGIIVFICSIASLMIKFTSSEINYNNQLRQNDYDKYDDEYMHTINASSNNSSINV